MMNQRTKSMLAVFIVVASSVVSIAAIEQPSNVKAVCKDDTTIIITQDHVTDYPAIFYKRGAVTTWTVVNAAGGQYVIPAEAAETANIQFSTDSTTLISPYQTLNINCMAKAGVVKDVDATIETVAAEEVRGSSDATMTVTPATFDFTKTSKIEIILAKSYEKAVIAKCDIFSSTAGSWVQIHKCDTVGNKLIKFDSFDKGNKKLTATMTQVKLADATDLRIRCTYDSCEAGACAHFDDTYTDGMCKA